MAGQTPEVTRRFLVSGLVQGVGFRHFVFQRGLRLGVAGWVSNLADGRVEVVARGTEAQLSVLASWLSEGPAHARVTGVEKTEISDQIDIVKPFVIK
jgi:acylphosphatase